MGNDIELNAWWVCNCKRPENEMKHFLQSCGVKPEHSTFEPRVTGLQPVEFILLNTMHAISKPLYSDCHWYKLVSKL